MGHLATGAENCRGRAEDLMPPGLHLQFEEWLRRHSTSAVLSADVKRGKHTAGKSHRVFSIKTPNGQPATNKKVFVKAVESVCLLRLCPTLGVGLLPYSPIAQELLRKKTNSNRSPSLLPKMPPENSSLISGDTGGTALAGFGETARTTSPAQTHCTECLWSWGLLYTATSGLCPADLPAACPWYFTVWFKQTFWTPQYNCEGSICLFSCLLLCFPRSMSFPLILTSRISKG